MLEADDLRGAPAALDADERRSGMTGSADDPRHDSRASNVLRLVLGAVLLALLLSWVMGLVYAP